MSSFSSQKESGSTIRSAAAEPLRLENARYEETDFGEILAVTVNGIPVTFCIEWKPTLREAGVVSLPPAVTGLPPVEITIPGKDRTVVLSDCTRDRRLYTLFLKFWHDAQRPDYRPGPVPIPE